MYKHQKVSRQSFFYFNCRKSQILYINMDTKTHVRSVSVFNNCLLKMVQIWISFSKVVTPFSVSCFLSLRHLSIAASLGFLTTTESSTLNKAQMQSPSNPNEMAGLLSSSIMHYSCFLLISFSCSHFSNHSFCLLMNIFLPCWERERERKRATEGETEAKRERPSARRRNGLVALHPWVICGREALYFIMG